VPRQSTGLDRDCMYENIQGSFRVHTSSTARDSSLRLAIFEKQSTHNLQSLTRTTCYKHLHCTQACTPLQFSLRQKQPTLQPLQSRPLCQHPEQRKHHSEKEPMSPPFRTTLRRRRTTRARGKSHSKFAQCIVILFLHQSNSINECCADMLISNLDTYSVRRIPRLKHELEPIEKSIENWSGSRKVRTRMANLMTRAGA
jgi:hypothetical protein